MRKLLRAKAKAEMARMGYGQINRHMSAEWRKITGAYPKFFGKAKNNRNQPVLKYR